MTAQTLPDRWLLPVLRDLFPQKTLDAFEANASGSYWQAAVATGAVTDEQLLAAIARRTNLRVANGLLVTSQAREQVPERLARRFRVLPLSVSESALEIATANPFDLDCERTLAFASGRAIRMSLASPIRDRKSTRLNSSHVRISYAVFCLKKKKHK